MLDVEAPLEGDIEESFTPYDRNVNVEVFYAHCAGRGIKAVSKGDAVWLTDHFDTFVCAHQGGAQGHQREPGPLTPQKAQPLGQPALPSTQSQD